MSVSYPWYHSWSRHTSDNYWQKIIPPCMHIFSHYHLRQNHWHWGYDSHRNALLKKDVSTTKSPFQIFTKLLGPKEYILLGACGIYSYGNRHQENSIKRLISIQPYLLHQETLLKTYWRKLGAKSNRKPVAHCDSIEFGWCFSKIIYRYKSLEDKKNKNKFYGIVRSVLIKYILTLLVCRINTHKARQDMATLH